MIHSFSVFCVSTSWWKHSTIVSSWIKPSPPYAGDSERWDRDCREEDRQRLAGDAWQTVSEWGWEPYGGPAWQHRQASWLLLRDEENGGGAQREIYSRGHSGEFTLLRIHENAEPWQSYFWYDTYRPIRDTYSFFFVYLYIPYTTWIQLGVHLL
jgi:hypothetical protein